MVGRVAWQEIAPFEPGVERLVSAAAVMSATLHLRKSARSRFSAPLGSIDCPRRPEGPRRFGHNRGGYFRVLHSGPRASTHDTAVVGCRLRSQWLSLQWITRGIGSQVGELQHSRFEVRVERIPPLSQHVGRGDTQHTALAAHCELAQPEREVLPDRLPSVEWVVGRKR